MIRKRAPKRSSATRTHFVGLVASILLVLCGVGAITLGVYAWTQERPPIAPMTPGTPVQLAKTPLFDPGVTVFARGDGREAAEPSAWHCTLTRNGQAGDLVVRPDFDSVGSRVYRGVPYLPVVTIGQSSPTDSVTCTPDALQTQEIAVMPTNVGVRSVPLSFVVGGIAAIGIAGLVHPRARGLRPFGA